MNAASLRQSLSILFPPACLVCDRSLKTGFLCFRCVPPIPNLSQALHFRCVQCFEPIASNTSGHESTCPCCLTLPLTTDAQRFVWEYRGLARDFIKAMKYRPSKKLARLAGTILSDSLPFVFPQRDWDLVVPIPSSAKTFRKRSFHPCLEMAHYVARTLSIPLKVALASNPKRNPQARLHHDARLKGMEQLFSVRSPRYIHKKRILLIEDVITTGATASAAARHLRTAGATRVDILALARAQAWRRFRHRVFESGGDRLITPLEPE